jgi:hypothetical protein
MLDDWLERLLREPPERRAKRQLRDVGRATRQTVKELREHPNDRLTGDILHTQTVRVAEITRQGIIPPPARCQTCGKRLPRPIGNPWSNNQGIALIWAILIAFLVVFLFPFIGWWVLGVFPAGWLLSQSFIWTFIVPFLLLVVVWVVWIALSPSANFL